MFNKPLNIFFSFYKKAISSQVLNEKLSIFILVNGIKYLDVKHKKVQ
jgi:hypothetical protein